MIDYTKILNQFYKDNQWSLNGDDYDGLVWLSDTPKPSKTTLDDLWSQVEAKAEADKIKKANAKSALLDRLGITEEEAMLLLGSV
jgi:hypothetical protein